MAELRLSPALTGHEDLTLISEKVPTGAPGGCVIILNAVRIDNGERLPHSWPCEEYTV